MGKQGVLVYRKPCQLASETLSTLVIDFSLYNCGRFKRYTKTIAAGDERSNLHQHAPERYEL